MRINYTAHIQPKLEYNSCVCVCGILDRIQRTAQVLMVDESVFRALNTPEHQHYVDCVAPMYSYVQGMRSTEEKSPPTKSFRRNTCLSHPLDLELSLYRPVESRDSSFFNRACRLWNNVPAVVFPAVPDIPIFKSNVYKHYSLPSPHFSCNRS